MATKEIDQIINLKSMYDFSISEVGELEIVKKDIKKIISLLGGGCGILTLSGKRDKQSYQVKTLIYGDNTQVNTKVKYAIFDRPLYDENVYHIESDFSKFNQRFNKFIKISGHINRLLCLPVIIQHEKSLNNIGEIFFLYNQKSFKEENGKHIERIIDRLLLRLRLSFTQDRMNRKVKQLTKIIGIGNKIESVKNKEDLLSIVIENGIIEYKSIFKHKAHAILRIEEDGVMKAIDLTESISCLPVILKSDSIRFKEVITQKESIIIGDYQNSPSIKELLREHKEDKEYCDFLRRIKSLMRIPIVAKNKVRGIYVLFSEDRDFTPAEKKFFDDLAVITAIAFNRLEDYQNISKELADKVKRLHLLHTLMKKIISEKDYNGLHQTILNSGLKLVNSKSGSIRILDKEKGELVKIFSKHDFIRGNIPLGAGVCGRVAQTGVSCKEDDVLNNESWCNHVINEIGKKEYKRRVDENEIMRSEISVPLKDGGVTIGSIDALRFEPNGFRDEDLEVFEGLAGLSGIIIKRKDLQVKLDTIKDIAAYYHKIRGGDLADVLGEILKKCLEITKSLKGSIAIVNETVNEKNDLEYLSVENVDGLHKGKHRNIKENIVELVMESTKEDKLGDISKYINHKKIDNSIMSEIVTPIIFETKLRGTLMVASSTQKRFDDDDRIILKAIANQTGILMHNIELIREREENYKKMENELIQNMMNMSGMMAHQINSPLTGIQLHFSIIKDKLNIGRYDLSENLKYVKNSIDKISKIIQKNKDFSKMVDLELNSLDLHEVLEEAVNFIKDGKVGYEIRIIKNFDRKNIKELNFDHYKILQVFINIIDNAFNAMREKEGNLKIKTLKKNSDIVIIFEDNGNGIPDKNKPKIFRTFFTTDKVHGTGLGLPICKRFVELHGGNIKMESTKGKGTTFIIILPYLKEGIQNE